jgi:Mn2+/Fe2+ NRAMP family transporter
LQDADPSVLAEESLLRTSWRRRLFLAVGPGLVVMLADTDSGSIITAAQSGTQQGYKLLLLQLLLVPILYIVQELTVRLGLATGRGHGELIKLRFGAGWAWISVATMAVACVGALLTELSGMAGVAQLFGVPVWIMMVLTVGFILTMVLTGSYRSVERVAIGFGIFEFAFLIVALNAGVDPAQLAHDAMHMPLGDSQFLYLAAANIGAVVMPWMVFYQQSAVVDKGLTLADLPYARLDTAVGAVLTQVIMAAVIAATAATIGRTNAGAALDSVPQIAGALEPTLGVTLGRVVFALGISGAALVATVVVGLTAAWGLGEVTGYKHSLEHHPREAPWFYGIFAVLLVLGGVLVTSGVPLVPLAVAVEVMNALLLPIVLGFLFLLARKALPPPYRLDGWYAWVAAIVIVVTTGFGVFAGVAGAIAN